MIYLDVTSSCKSPMNTGVQRVVRGLHRTLAQALGPGGVTPVLWEPRLRDYCALSARERGFLEAPFAGRAGRRALEEPGRAANPVPGWSKFWRQVVHRRNRRRLVTRLTATDTLFVPEIFQDSRIAWLRELRLHSPARRVAVFHDAIAWKRPEITPAARYAGFADYMLALAECFHGVVAVSEEAAADLRFFWKGHAPEAPPEIRVAGWPGEKAAAVATGAAEVTVRAIAAPSVVCVGTFEPRKNHLTLLAAAELAWRAGAKFSLVLIGRTTPAHGRQVEAEVERLRAAGRSVHWLRHVHDAALLAAYRAALFTVFPSLVEGYGLPIVESLTHGRPVVCGGNGAIGELATGGGCLIVNQTDPQALADGICQLLTDADLHARLVAEAGARKFPTWEEYVADCLPFLCPTPAEI